MPNPIKYNVSAQTLALKEGNFWIATGDVPKGTTVNTDYWNGITPPVGGYTIYLNKASQGPSIYVAANDDELISLTNRIGNQSFTTVAQSLSWYLTQTDKMVLNIDYPAIITNGLVLNLDAGFVSSYPESGTTWYDLSNGSNNGTLVNGPTFNSADGGSIVFDGANDYCSTSLVKTFTSMTIQVWFYGDGNQNGTFGYAGVVANRTSSSDATGLLLNNGNNQSLGYNWNNVSNTWTWNSGLVLNYTGWHFLSLSVAPATATAFLNGATATNFVSHSPASITSLAIGKDYLTERYINGRISSVYIYDRALSNTEVQQNYNTNVDRFQPIQTYSTVGYIDCAGNSVTVYFSSRIPVVVIGTRVYYDSNLTSIASNITWASYFPSDYEFIGITADSNGFIVSLTTQVGGC